MWSEPQRLDKINKELIANEFGIAPDSFLLVLRKYVRCYNNKYISLIHQ